MEKRLVFVSVCIGLLASACEDPKPNLSGRLRSPADMVVFKGCAQNDPGCSKSEKGHHLLLMSNAQSDDLKIFDVEKRNFFKALNPLFPFSIPVGGHPRALAVEPYGEYGLVINQLTSDVSLVNLAPNRLVEVDTDANQGTVAASLNCPENPNQTENPINDRCLSGVSRAGLGDAEQPLPVDLAIPAGPADPEQSEPWPRDQALPVWVSLLGAGQIAELHFRYPGGGLPQRLAFQRVYDLGGMPSGLAVTRDGSILYIADEDSDSIAILDTATGDITRVVVDGPSRSVFLSPDEATLYVLRLDESRIALVDTATRQRQVPYIDPEVRAQDPEGDGLDIVIPGIPREITFVTGSTLNVADENLSTTTYPLGEEYPFRDFAFVSDLNGNVYILDALRHGSIDSAPLVGPRTTTPGLIFDGDVQREDALWKCLDPAFDYGACPWPNIANINCSYSTRTTADNGVVTYTWVEAAEVTGDDGKKTYLIECPLPTDDSTETIHHGIKVFPGVTRDEAWILTYEGIVPGTEESTTGRFDGWHLVDDRESVDFERSRVFTGEEGKPADVLVVLSPAAESAAGSGQPHEACIPDGSEKVRTEFSVIAVGGTNQLSIAPVAGVDPGLCWPGAIRYNIRANDAWTVYGLLSGPQERVYMVPTGGAPAHPNDSVYSNPYFALTMMEPDPDSEGNPRKVPRGTIWSFSTESNFHQQMFAPSIRAGMAGAILTVDLEDGETHTIEVDTDGNDETEPVEIEIPVDERVYLLFEGSNALMEFFPGALEGSNYLLYQ